MLLVLAVAGVSVFLALLLWPSGEAAPRLETKNFSLIAVDERTPLPDAEGPALDPPPPSLGFDSLHGQAALVNVWASWCVPCREEAPVLARLWRQYRSQVRFLGVDVEDSRAEARGFVRRYGVGYPHIFDAQATLAGRLGFFGLPTTYLVDARGRVAAKLIGKQQEPTLRAALRALAAEIPRDG